MTVSDYNTVLSWMNEEKDQIIDPGLLDFFASFLKEECYIPVLIQMILKMDVNRLMAYEFLINNAKIDLKIYNRIMPAFLERKIQILD